jgi:hypothetical protein
MHQFGIVVARAAAARAAASFVVLAAAAVGVVKTLGVGTVSKKGH